MSFPLHCCCSLTDRAACGKALWPVVEKHITSTKQYHGYQSEPDPSKVDPDKVNMFPLVPFLHWSREPLPGVQRGQIDNLPWRIQAWVDMVLLSVCSGDVSLFWWLVM